MKTAQNDSERQLQTLRDTRAAMLAQLAVEVKLMRKYELRFQRDRTRNDRHLRDKFARMVDDRLSELSRISFQIDVDDQEVSHG